MRTPRIGLGILKSRSGGAPTPPSPLWEYLGSKEMTGTGFFTNTPSRTDCPMGADDVNKKILAVVSWGKYATGTHEIASMTLGGVSGTRRARSLGGQGTWNCEQWTFDGGSFTGNQTIAWIKGGGAATPYWNAGLWFYKYIGTMPTLLEGTGVTSGTLTTSNAGHHVFGWCKGANSGAQTWDFDLGPVGVDNYRDVNITTLRYTEGMAGNVMTESGGVMDTSLGSGYLSATVWEEAA